MKKLELKGFKLGETVIKHGLVLAPMAGATDYAFREVCRDCGAELTVSEMISAKALCYEQLCKKKNAPELSRTAPLAAVRAEELPMSVQLFGSEPEFMAEAAALIESGEYFGSKSTAKPTAIDINMGCPVAKVVGNGEGSALMKDIALAGRIVRAITDRVKLPVTVKMRAGWDRDSINAPELARAVEQSGAAMICVHGRTRSQMYEPSADYNVIGEVKKAVSVPVVGNGDIYSASDALRMLDVSGCDGVAVGRGALGNPWIFSELLAVAKGEEFLSPNIGERLRVALGQAVRMTEEKGEYIAVREARKHVAWYIKGVRGAAEARNRINSAETLSDIEKIAKEIAEQTED
ncbi:MAG: tRNA dihydrouridine synthase DusB [Ruminococcaceae bacterium]|nr:tRNA dihydrouridine synthase DusB [Oscillospiraceae bacterium]